VSIKDELTVTQVEHLNNEHKRLFIRYHASHRWQTPAKYKFILSQEDKVIGVALFGHPTSARATSVYGEDILELKKFVTKNATKKNTESFFLSKCMKELKKLGHYRFITYADPKFGHTGGLYKAANFSFVKQGKSNYIYIKKEVSAREREYIQERQVYAKGRDGEYTPSAKKFQTMVKSGELIRELMTGKLVFKFEFKNGTK